MKIRTDALVAVGAAIKGAEQKGVPHADIAKVSLDGTSVDVDAALEALAVASETAPKTPPGIVTRVLDRLETRVQSVEAKLETTTLGKRLVAIINKDPERVSREGRVEIELKDGRKIEIPVVIVSRALSKALQAVAIGATALSLTPIVGSFVLAGTALASGLAALIAAGVGDAALAKSLGGMAAKYGTLLAVSIIPVFSNLVGAAALVADRADLKELKKPPSVADIVNLAAFAQPAVAQN